MAIQLALILIRYWKRQFGFNMCYWKSDQDIYSLLMCDQNLCKVIQYIILVSRSEKGEGLRYSVLPSHIFRANSFNPYAAVG